MAEGHGRGWWVLCGFQPPRAGFHQRCPLSFVKTQSELDSDLSGGEVYASKMPAGSGPQLGRKSPGACKTTAHRTISSVPHISSHHLTISSGSLLPVVSMM